MSSALSGAPGKEFVSGYSWEDYWRQGISVSLCAKDVRFVPVYQRGKKPNHKKPQ